MFSAYTIYREGSLRSGEANIIPQRSDVVQVSCVSNFRSTLRMKTL